MFRKLLGAFVLALFLAACNTNPANLVVSSVSPVDGAEGVSVDTVISATFSLGVTEASVLDAFEVVVGDDPVEGGVTYDAATRRATFAPTAALDFATTYTVTVSESVATPGGLLLGEDVTWSFTTEADTETEPSIGDLTLSPAADTLVVGEALALTLDWVDVVGSPDLSVTWSSDNEAAATVLDGVVTAVAPGVAEITATSVFDGGVSASATITVATLLEGTDYILTEDAGTLIEILPDVSGGVGPYTFTLLPSDLEADPPLQGLPDGVSIDEVSGVISGTPEFAGFYRAAILVTDALGQELEVLAEIVVDLVLSYEQTVYTYAAGGGGVGPLMDVSDITVVGSSAGVLFTMAYVDSGPVAGPTNAFTIDEDTGVVSRANVVAADTTTWTYTVTAADFDSGFEATFTLTINRLP